MQWYARQVANNPSLVILFVLVMTTTCIIIALTVNDLPTFKDPLLGFQPRGTKLAQRTTAWKNLLESTSWSGPFTLYPGSVVSNTYNRSSQASPWEKLIKGENGKGEDNTSVEDSVGTWLELETEEQNFDHVLEKGEIDLTHTLFHRGFGHRKQRIPPLDRKNFFCNNPSRNYAHVIIQSISGENLFTLKGLKSVCQMDDKKLRKKSPNFTKLCEETPWQTCCQSWSIPNYVALLRNRSSCHDVTQQDVTYVLKLLASCSTFYHDMKLSHDCATDPALCHDIPKPCTEYDAVYNMLHYLADVNFLNPETPHYNTPKLMYTSIFLPTAQSSQALDYYRDLEQMKLSDGIIEVVGMELGLKYKLFDICLIHDTIYVGLAGGLIFILLWIYSSSFFVTFMTIMAVAFSLATAYFMYTVVYQIKFFPFMNLLTIVIIIGIGADDACIYCKIWVCAKAEKSNGTLVKLVRDTLHHACLSMFVTSVTTSAAFFGSVISNITAVRCFSIFAGTAVLANFIFTVSWLPASVIMAEKWCSATCLCIPPLGVYLPQIQSFWWCSTVCNSLWKIHYSFTDTSRVFFEKILPCIVVKPRYFWLTLFTGLAAAAAVVVFYYPRLRLPDSKELQIFSSDHPFERYDLVLKKYFWFEKAKDREVYRKLPIRIIWGVLPVDNGNYLNPYDKGTLVLDPQFNITSQDSQKWLLSFCISLRNQSFYHLTHGPLLSNCFIETFKTWMERRCMDGFTDRTPCCETSKFPFTEDVFNLCIREAITVLHRTPGYFFIPGVEGPRFSKSSGDIKAVVVEYDSVYTYSNSYSEINEFQSQVGGWVTKMMRTAPAGMKNGWFISHLEFFDLQDSLSQGTHIAIGVAIGVSFIALLITTLNLLISVYAILTIACVIVVTVASLVLVGWKLNVLESTTVSIAIGLAVDLTLHYGVAYKLSPQEDRESSVIFCLARVGSPVAMAAFTTFMAGALMFPATVVLAYLQIGTFLVILMTVSWLYATFFFLPLLSIMGPQNGQLQLSYPTVHCCDTSSVPAEKAPYALSESTLSSSSASYPNQIPTSESHELEPLTNLKGNRIDIPKYSKKKHGQHASRQRSGSFSSALSKTRDSTFPVQNNRTPRKISLPTVNVTFHGDPSPRHITGAISSSTIVCNEEEKEVMVPSVQEMIQVKHGLEKKLVFDKGHVEKYALFL